MRVESKVENTWHCLSIQKAGTKEEEKKKENQKRENEKLEMKQAVGFSNLLKKIVESVSVYTYIHSMSDLTGYMELICKQLLKKLFIQKLFHLEGNIIKLVLYKTFSLISLICTIFSYLYSLTK